MPNPWTRIKQQAYECFYGPRTIDYQFGQKVEEVKMVQEQLHLIKELIQTFTKRTEGIRAVFNEASNNFSVAYPKGSPYSGFANDVGKVHKALENAYSVMANSMNRLSKELDKWNQPFVEIHNELKQRDHFRKIYDHYDEKLAGLVQKRNDKFNKGKEETDEEIEKFERNDKKFRDAANDFIKQSNLTYNRMQNLIDRRFMMISPVICDFIEIERIFFTQCASYLSYFKDAKPKVIKLEIYHKKTPVFYNCAKFLRGAAILGQNLDKVKQPYVESGSIGGGDVYVQPQQQNPQARMQGMNNYPSGRPGGPQGGQGGGYRSNTGNTGDIVNFNDYQGSGSNPYGNIDFNQRDDFSQRNAGFPQNNQNSGFPRNNQNSGFPQNNQNSGFPQNNQNSGFPQNNQNSGFPQNNQNSGFNGNNNDFNNNPYSGGNNDFNNPNPYGPPSGGNNDFNNPNPYSGDNNDFNMGGNNDFSNPNPYGPPTGGNNDFNNPNPSDQSQIQPDGNFNENPFNNQNFDQGNNNPDFPGSGNNGNNQGGDNQFNDGGNQNFRSNPTKYDLPTESTIKKDENQGDGLDANLDFPDTSNNPPSQGQNNPPNDFMDSSDEENKKNDK